MPSLPWAGAPLPQLTAAFVFAPSWCDPHPGAAGHSDLLAQPGSGPMGRWREVSLAPVASLSLRLLSCSCPSFSLPTRPLAFLDSALNLPSVCPPCHPSFSRVSLGALWPVSCRMVLIQHLPLIQDQARLGPWSLFSPASWLREMPEEHLFKENGWHFHPQERHHPGSIITKIWMAAAGCICIHIHGWIDIPPVGGIYLHPLLDVNLSARTAAEQKNRLRRRKGRIWNSI